MRKYLVAGLAVALILTGGMFALLRPRHCRVNRAAFGRVEEGMTRAEVHATLGGPPGDYRTRPPHPAFYFYPEHTNGLLWFPERWEGDEGTAELWFNPIEGTFAKGTFQVAEPYSPGPLGLALWRLGKLKEAWLP